MLQSFEQVTHPKLKTTRDATADEQIAAISYRQLKQTLPTTASVLGMPIRTAVDSRVNSLLMTQDFIRCDGANSWRREFRNNGSGRIAAGLIKRGHWAIKSGCLPVSPASLPLSVIHTSPVLAVLLSYGTHPLSSPQGRASLTYLDLIALSSHLNNPPCI